jgi:hypothetical protein
MGKIKAKIRWIEKHNEWHLVKDDKDENRLLEFPTCDEGRAFFEGYDKEKVKTGTLIWVPDKEEE